VALSYEDFLARFPEFEEASRTLVEAKIAEADLLHDDAVWGAQADLGRGYKTAELLALSPWGQNARMVNKDGSTTYGTVWEELQSRVAFGFRVI